MSVQTVGQNCCSQNLFWNRHASVFSRHSNFKMRLHMLGRTFSRYTSENYSSVRFDRRTWFWQIFGLFWIFNWKQVKPLATGLLTTKCGLWQLMLNELPQQVIEAISTGWSGQDILSPLQILFCSSDGVNSTQTWLLQFYRKWHYKI